MALTQEQLQAGRECLALKIKNNEIPEFDRKDQAKAQAHIDAINDCFPSPVLALESETTYRMVNVVQEEGN